MNGKKELGKLIANTRISRDLSRAKLAKLTGLDEMKLFRIEHGTAKRTSDKDLKAISDALNLKLTVNRL